MEADQITLTYIINRLARLDERAKTVLAEESKAFWEAFELYRNEVNRRFPPAKNERGEVTSVHTPPTEGLADLFNPLFYIPPHRRFLHNEVIPLAPEVSEKQRKMCDRAILTMIHDVALRSEQTPIYYGDPEEGFHTKMLAWGAVPEGLYRALTQGRGTSWTDDEFEQMLVHFDGCIDDLEAEEGVPRFGFHGQGRDELAVRYVFENKGATWWIVYGEHETTVDGSKGMTYIRYLIEHANTPIECRNIERACSKEAPESGRRMGSGEATEAGLHANGHNLKQLDDWEAEDIEKMIERLKGTMEDTNDTDRKTELQKQILALREYLGKNLNIHGQGRPVDEREKARWRVSKAINAAKQAIESRHKQIGEHFQSAVKADGTAFIYKPDRELTWIVE